MTLRTLIIGLIVAFASPADAEDVRAGGFPDGTELVVEHVPDNDELNMRVLPDETSQVIARLGNRTGGLFATGRRKGQWVEVIFAGKRGWVSDRYVAQDTSSDVPGSDLSDPAAMSDRSSVIDLFRMAVEAEREERYEAAQANYAAILKIEKNNALAKDGVRRMQRDIKDQEWNPQQTSSFEIWEHNGSLMKLIKDGREWTFLYEEPRAGLVQVGIKRGTWLMKLHFKGNSSIEGTARIFTKRCGPVEYRVAARLYVGSVIADGLIPQLNTKCKRTGTVTPDEGRFISSAISE